MAWMALFQMADVLLRCASRCSCTRTRRRAPLLTAPPLSSSGLGCPSILAAVGAAGAAGAAVGGVAAAREQRRLLASEHPSVLPAKRGL